MSRGHYLKPNEKSETIHQAVWFDTETTPVQLSPLETGHVLMQGWAAFSQWRKSTGWSDLEWFRFEGIDEFWVWVESRTRPKTKLYVFCHNTGFDLPVMDAFHWLPEHGWEAHKVIADGPPTMIEVRKQGASLCLLDTLNWWRMPLRALGQSIGLPKLDMPGRDAGQEAWDTYNRRDVEIIARTVQRWCDFLRGNDLGGFAQTLAGQAMRTFRHRFMDHKILIDSHTNALACSREAYHGGRVEAFFIGAKQGDFYLLDVNSMFPAMMLRHTYPAVYAHYSKLTNPQDLRAMLRKYLVCARVRVTVDKPVFPTVQGGRLVFPVGTFDCALSTPELKWAIKHGAIERVYDMAMYTGQPLFRRFIREMYNLRLAARKRGDEVNAYLYKILMNSLYGKWGQRGFRYERVGETDDLDPAAWKEVDLPSGNIEHYKRILGWVMRLTRDSESAGSHPAIAAHVTAHARMHLFELIEEAGNDHVYYCDTDSVLVDSAGFECLRHRLDDTRLGALKLEGHYGDIEIHGAKDYRFGQKCKTKGVRASARWTAPNTVEQERWSGLRGMIRSGNVDMPVVTLMEKHLSRRYLKGTVTESGRVQPLVLG